MKYSATIMWLDNDNIEDVIITTDEENFWEDDDIFHYFVDEEEIKSYQKESGNEFIILEYIEDIQDEETT